MTELVLITATAFNAQGECASSCALVEEGETLEEVCEQQKANALEIFEDDYYGAIHVAISVARVSLPEIDHTIAEHAPIIETVRPKIA